MLNVTFEFQVRPGELSGTFSAPSMRALGIPLNKLTITGSEVHFELGDDPPMVFDGRLIGTSINGAFREGDGRGTFSLVRRARENVPYQILDVHFSNGGVTLAGTLLLPPGSGAHPAVVFNHGSGPEGRFASRFYADYFARHSIAALIYDKRGVGESKGDWRTATFDDLAADAAAAVGLLRQRPEVDGKAIGIYGHSQGGTIAPLIAARNRDVAFVIAAAGIGGPVYEQDTYRVHNGLRSSGFSEQETAQAMVLYTQFLTVARTGEGWAAYDKASQAVSQERWFSWLGLPPKDHWLWPFYRSIGNYDSLPFWAQVKVPALLVYGERDQVTALHPDTERIEAALKKGGNPDYTIVILPRAAHNLTVGAEPGQPFEWWHVAPGYLDLLTAWINQRFGRK